jgi:holdfast attachment protein HfaA
MTMGRTLFALPFAAAAALIYGAEVANATEFAGSTPANMTSSNGSMAPYANDRTYSNGYNMQPGQENVAASGGTRDANGNRVITNHGMGSGSMSTLQGHAQSGVGQPGMWGNSANATAIGNQLNVVVVGSWNTVIVDSTQINNGDQNANASLNGKLNF